MKAISDQRAGWWRFVQAELSSARPMRSLTATSAILLSVGLVLGACGNAGVDGHDALPDSAAPSEAGPGEGTDAAETSVSSDGSYAMTADAGPDAPSQSVQDGGSIDATGPDAESNAGPDAEAQDSGDGGPTVCSVSGAPGECIEVSACAVMTDHTAFAGHCPGPTDIQCCITTPSTSDNPPTPTGYQLMAQSQVTPQMTAWAVAILNDPTTYPMSLHHDDGVQYAHGAGPRRVASARLSKRRDPPRSDAVRAYLASAQRYP